MQWVKCEDRLPELETDVFVCKMEKNRGLVFDRDMLFWFQNAGIQWCSLSLEEKNWEYWAPIPDDFFPEEYKKIPDNEEMIIGDPALDVAIFPF